MNRRLRELFEEGGDGVGTKLRRVEGGGRQAAEGGRDFLGSDGSEFGGRFAEEEVGENGAGSNSGDTTLSFEASGGDAAGIEANG